MKKISIVLLIGFCFALNSIASDADLFNYDKATVNQELQDLQSLENYVNSNPGVTLTDLKLDNNQLVSELNISAGNLGSFFASIEPPLGIPSFLWGCVFGVVGVAVVYFVADDKEETKKSFKGCVVGTLSATLLYVLFFVVLFSSAATTASTI